MKQKTNFTKLIQVWGIVLIVGVAVSITTIDIIGSYRDFNSYSGKIRADYIASQKEMVKQEVKRVVELILYEKSQGDALTRRTIKSRVYEAFSIAENIYQQNQASKSKAEIETMIMDGLRPICFAGESGYYFATRLDGIEVLFADKPEMEGLNLLGVQDTHGQYVVKDMIEIAMQSGEGFYEYHWTKPDREGNDFKKISFVKLFEPYGWFIGTGLYVEDIEGQIKENLLSTISRIRFGKEGYIFVNRLNGDALVSSGKLISGTKKLWEVFNKNPEKTKKIYDKEYRAALTAEGDYIYYSLTKLTTPDIESPKVSFIYGLPDLQWLIGAGVYLDDVEADIVLLQTDLQNQIKAKILFSSLVTIGLLLFFLLLLRRLNKRLENDFKLFGLFFNKAAISGDRIDRSLVQFDELDQMAKNANKMLQDKLFAQEELSVEREVLRDSEEKFRRIVESITDVYYETGFDGTIYYCSPSCLEVSGYSQEELIGSNASILYSDPDDRQLLLNAMQKDGMVRNMDLLFKKKNGDLYDVSFNADLSLDENGDLTRLTGTIRDITTVKKVKREIQRSKKMEAIGLMAGGVAHDLNNILSGIVGYPELLLQSLGKDSPLIKPLKAIHDSGQRAATVVADLLTVARGVASTREVCNINALLEEHVNSPEYKELRSLYPDIAYRHQFTATRPNVSCSSVHVKKCFINLVTNAVEAMENDGTITVSTKNEYIDASPGSDQRMAAGEYVVISVRDTGPGISSSDLEHIFEPFYTKKVMGRSGTGLGLAIVWNTMEDHEGKVIVKNSSEGTCFQLYFPASKGGNAPSEHDKRKRFIGKNEHILIVDDEPQLRDIASQMLRSLGYTVDSVSSGELALQFVEGNHVDLLVIDMLMEPGMNGRQTYEEIIKLYPDQKAIIVSGFSESDDVKSALRLGASGFIKKPYSMEQLGRVVKEALDS